MGVCLTIRVAYLALCLVNAVLLPPYDSSLSSVHPAMYNAASIVTGAGRWRDLFGRLGPWDSVFFRDIAERGYAYEQFFAFYPLFPGKKVI